MKLSFMVLFLASSLIPISYLRNKKEIQPRDHMVDLTTGEPIHDSFYFNQKAPVVQGEYYQETFYYLELLGPDGNPNQVAMSPIDFDMSRIPPGVRYGKHWSQVITLPRWKN